MTFSIQTILSNAFTSGYSGAQGPQGASGYSGAKGADGVLGGDGQPGASGVSGYSGYSGSAGIPGLNGVDGLPGASGYSGYSGWGSVFANDIQRCGFLNQTETTIAFDGTNTFTLGDAGAGWSYYINGTKHTISGSKTITLTGSPPAAKARYYITIQNNGTGALSVSTTVWDLLDPTTIPVATVNWDNAATPKYWLADERHSTKIDRRTHYYEHTTNGTRCSVFGSLTNVNVAPGTPTTALNCVGVTATTLQDEDIVLNLAALTAPNGTNTDYVLYYRTAATTWNWLQTNAPYPYSATYVQWDNAGTLTTGNANRWYNSYILFTDFSGAARYIIVPGRAEFNSLANAQAEDPTAFDWGGISIAEFVVAYQLTWNTAAGYGSAGRCRLAATPKKINISATNVTASASTVHNGLTGLQGGVISEYYHLTAAEYAALQATGGSGISGYSGTSGATGATGAQGISGYSGAAGSGSGGGVALADVIALAVAL